MLPGQIPGSFQAGDILVWRVRGNPTTTAEQQAQDLGQLVDTHQLGHWGAFPIGLGDEAWWFDLTISNQVAAIVVVLILGELPDAVY
jgi:hypothetical protein